MTVPALTGRDELVDAVGRERRDEAVDVAAVLGDRVTDPEALDPAELGRVEGPPEASADRRAGVRSGDFR
jgi:hypothetical protein